MVIYFDTLFKLHFHLLLYFSNVVTRKFQFSHVACIMFLLDISRLEHGFPLPYPHICFWYTHFREV